MTQFDMGLQTKTVVREVQAYSTFYLPSATGVSVSNEQGSEIFYIELYQGDRRVAKIESDIYTMRRIMKALETMTVLDAAVVVKCAECGVEVLKKDSEMLSQVGQGDYGPLCCLCYRELDPGDKKE
jgi:hypothetical protein